MKEFEPSAITLTCSFARLVPKEAYSNLHSVINPGIVMWKSAIRYREIFKH
jgi:hypothetical protein